MTELSQIAKEKIDRRLAAVNASLRTRIAVVQSEHAKRGVFHSSMHVHAMAAECCVAYAAAASAISEELLWWLSQALYVPEGTATEIANVGIERLSAVAVVANEIAQKASTLMSGSEMSQAALLPVAAARTDAEKAIRLFVRQWRAEHQRGMLRTTWSRLVSVVRWILGLRSAGS